MYVDRYRFANDPFQLSAAERSLFADLLTDKRRKLREIRAIARDWRQVGAGYRALEDRESRSLFRALILYRVATPHLSRVARNRALAQAADEHMRRELACQPTDFPAFLGEPINLFSLDHNGHPFEVATTKYGAFWTTISDQYFFRRGSVYVGPAQHDIVLDCGTCLGDTAIRLAAHVGPLGHVYSFDPDPSHILIARSVAERNRLIRPGHHRNTHDHAAAITFVNCGVAAQTRGELGELIYHQPSGEAVGISPGRRLTPTDGTVSIDDFCRSIQLTKVDYIKMDIEGAEIAALEGAHETIEQHRPKLAICVYHSPSDLWTIPAMIKRRYPFYRLYLGHHSLHLEETVLYAVVRTSQGTEIH